MKIIRLTISFILLLWCGGFFYFLQMTDDISNDNRTTTDAIVCLEVANKTCTLEYSYLN